MNGHLKALTESAFVADDIRLFLDTHPDCEEARADYRTAANAVRCEKEQLRYAINAMDAGENCSWDWVETPWPWEKGE